MFAVSFIAACDTDKPNPNEHSIGEVKEDNSTFGIWLRNNYLRPYNVEFQYIMDDFETSPTFNLVPARIDKSKEMAVILKHLWFDAYNEVTGNSLFISENAPRLICLIGSTAIDAEARTEKLGSAEGGIKIMLYDMNNMDPTDIEKLNLYYFKTMHHEFAHILHQKKSYNQEEFNAITGSYSLNGWINLDDIDAWKLGCPSAYACSQPREDFVEMIALYVTMTDEWWDNMMFRAGDTGRPALEKKLAFVTKWLKEKWNIDIDELRAAVRRRADDIPRLLTEIDF